MKKMLLVSMFQNVANILRKVEPNLENKTVTYIPTASIVEKLGFFVKMEKWKLKRLSLIVDELEISTSSYETIKDTLQRNDFIYITGGNTFFLLQELKRTGADKLLVEEINKGKALHRGICGGHCRGFRHRLLCGNGSCGKGAISKRLFRFELN